MNRQISVSPERFANNHQTQQQHERRARAGAESGVEESIQEEVNVYCRGADGQQMGISVRWVLNSPPEVLDDYKVDSDQDDEADEPIIVEGLYEPIVRMSSACESPF